MERVHKANADFGMQDYYKFYKRKYDKVSKQQFSKIISDFNEAIIESIINDNLEYVMPYIAFEISIRKHKRKPSLRNGKLCNNIPIDWKATNELWKKDPRAKEKGLRIRFKNSHTNGYVFRIFCKKTRCSIANKTLIKYKPSRLFQRKLSKRIKDPKKDMLDAFLLFK